MPTEVKKKNEKKSNTEKLVYILKKGPDKLAQHFVSCKIRLISTQYCNRCKKDFKKKAITEPGTPYNPRNNYR